MSEIYLKYNYIIDTMDTPTSLLNKECVERIKLLFFLFYCFKYTYMFILLTCFHLYINIYIIIKKIEY
jgi:hypothetical protein